MKIRLRSIQSDVVLCFDLFCFSLGDFQKAQWDRFSKIQAINNQFELREVTLVVVRTFPSLQMKIPQGILSSGVDLSNPLIFSLDFALTCVVIWSMTIMGSVHIEIAISMSL